MSSPFICEPLTLDNETKEQPKPNPDKHPGVSDAVNTFTKIIEDPSDVDNQWKFISEYMTLLNKNDNEILSVFNKVGKNEESDLFSYISKYGSQSGSWGLFEFFASIVSICTQVSQGETDENQNFILQCVMLSNDNNSPVFSYTELLHKYTQSPNEIYKTINEKFLEKYYPQQVEEKTP